MIIRDDKNEKKICTRCGMEFAISFNGVEILSCPSASCGRSEKELCARCKVPLTREEKGPLCWSCEFAPRCRSHPDKVGYNGTQICEECHKFQRPRK